MLHVPCVGPSQMDRSDGKKVVRREQAFEAEECCNVLEIESVRVVDQTRCFFVSENPIRLVKTLIILGHASAYENHHERYASLHEPRNPSSCYAAGHINSNGLVLLSSILSLATRGSS